MNRAMKIGKAAELRVASELLFHGFVPSLTLENSEIDIILTNGIRIQVKGSTLTTWKGAAPRYVFNFKGWKRDENGVRRFEKHNLKNIDFVILWAIEDNLFFIFPVGEIRKRYSYSIGFTPRTRTKRRGKNCDLFMKYENKWNLLNSKGGET